MLNAEEEAYQGAYGDAPMLRCIPKVHATGSKATDKAHRTEHTGETLSSKRTLARGQCWKFFTNINVKLLHNDWKLTDLSKFHITRC